LKSRRSFTAELTGAHANRNVTYVPLKFSIIKLHKPHQISIFWPVIVLVQQPQWLPDETIVLLSLKPLSELLASLLMQVLWILCLEISNIVSTNHNINI
jgi:hypothetical protein